MEMISKRCNVVRIINGAIGVEAIRARATIAVGATGVRNECLLLLVVIRTRQNNSG